MGVLDDPCYTYTIGLEHSFEHPELIILGMPPNLAGRFLNELGQQIAGGRRYSSGDVLLGEEIHCSSNLLFGEVSPQAREEYLLSARWFYHGNDFRSLQVLWPDRHDRFPAEPGFERQFLAQQPLLSHA